MKKNPKDSVDWHRKMTFKIRIVLLLTFKTKQKQGPRIVYTHQVLLWPSLFIPELSLLFEFTLTNSYKLGVRISNTGIDTDSVNILLDGQIYKINSTHSRLWMYGTLSNFEYQHQGVYFIILLWADYLESASICFSGLLDQHSA